MVEESLLETFDASDDDDVGGKVAKEAKNNEQVKDATSKMLQKWNKLRPILLFFTIRRKV